MNSKFDLVGGRYLINESGDECLDVQKAILLSVGQERHNSLDENVSPWSVWAAYGMKSSDAFRVCSCESEAKAKIVLHNLVVRLGQGIQPTRQ